MQKKIKRFLLGKPLKNDALKHQKLGIIWGLPILSSDAISSVAYAGQEMLIVLIPAVGIAAYAQMSILSWCIIGLLMVLMLSYRQTIEGYPNGGGAFIVAKENLGSIPGMVAGAALSVDYILTVAVSVSSGIEQITSAFEFLRPYKVVLGVALIFLLMLGNLRGLRESSKMFGIPAYAFILGIVALIVMGAFKLMSGYNPPEPQSVEGPVGTITLLLMLKAFASGCTALTGVEAVSNAVPNFRKPSVKYAKMVLLLLSIIILILFGGTSVIAIYYHVDPSDNQAMLILIAEEIFGKSFMYYYITGTTFIILILAANTAYSGFPMLIAVMAKEKYAPKHLSMRGDKLSFDNGIILLSVVSMILIIGFKADVTALIGLYAVGVFISFTLSQSGMLMRWKRIRGRHWHLKAAINGFGALLTAIVVVIIAFGKFNEGSWIVIVLIPLMVLVINRIHNHYIAVAKQLKIAPDEYSKIDFSDTNYHNRIIVPIENVNKASIRALRYAVTIADNVTAFTVAVDEDAAKIIRKDYDKLTTDIPLVIKLSPFRKIVEPLLRFIESAEYDYQKNDMITVLFPDIELRKRWHAILHSKTRTVVMKKLLRQEHIVVSVMPFKLKDDKKYLRKSK